MYAPMVVVDATVEASTGAGEASLFMAALTWLVVYILGP